MGREVEFSNQKKKDNKIGFTLKSRVKKNEKIYVGEEIELVTKIKRIKYG